MDYPFFRDGGNGNPYKSHPGLNMLLVSDEHVFNSEEHVLVPQKRSFLAGDTLL